MNHKNLRAMIQLAVIMMPDEHRKKFEEAEEKIRDILAEVPHPSDDLLFLMLHAEWLNVRAEQYAKQPSAELTQLLKEIFK
jgi:hypothetical protein